MAYGLNFFLVRYVGECISEERFVCHGCNQRETLWRGGGLVFKGGSVSRRSIE